MPALKRTPYVEHAELVLWSCGVPADPGRGINVFGEPPVSYDQTVLDDYCAFIFAVNANLLVIRHLHGQTWPESETAIFLQ